MTDSYSRSGASPPVSRTVEPTYEGDFVLDGSLPLECGRSLICPTLHYAVYGRLNAARDNAVLVCHALSGSALVGSWWPEIFAPGAVLSLEHDFVICINMLGSCYGSTGPGSVNPKTGEIYGPDFPLVGVRDNVRVQARLLDLIRGLIAEMGLAVVLVTHDLAVARLLSNRILVMKQGEVIEAGLTDRVLDDPQAPYTQLLVSSVLAA